jgi:hypothetical protein
VKARKQNRLAEKAARIAQSWNKPVSLLEIGQYEYLSENWINRGVPTTEVIEVNDAGLSISTAEGFANDG